MALIALGCCLFTLEQKNKENNDMCESAATEHVYAHADDAKIEFGEVE